MRILLSRGASVTTAVRIVSRVQRGGGLAREIVYLPAMVRVARATAADAIVERLMSRGRIAADAAKTVAGAIGWDDADPADEVA
jgi:hypothetical protein